MDATACARALLAWYDRHARTLPWRVGPRDVRRGARPNPYHVWLSEIMLQQTAVATVQPYFQEFAARWPDVAALAAADRDAVMAAWAGLGYYARARNLHDCARTIARQWGGQFPESEAELKTLPGIGPYTAAAIAAIAFDRPAVVVDGNVERVMARLFAIEAPLPGAKAELRRFAGLMTPDERPGDYAQAAMDLGATVCTPRSPDCGACPVKRFCRAHARGIVGRLPARAKKAPIPTRFGAAFWLERADGAVLLHRRPDIGLLGGMMGFPTGPWESEMRRTADALADAPLTTASWRQLAGRVTHTFTHFHLELVVFRARGSLADGAWGRPPDFTGFALPSLMAKIARHVLAHSE